MPPILLLTVTGAIGPASADYIERGIGRAKDEGAQLVVLRLDTPGGLDASMRQIIRVILASPVPIAIHVTPSGARAASAGTYMLYAAHVAAMAPGTNLGAATPVRIGGPSPGQAPQADDKADSAMAKKQVNDAAAYIRGLAQLRGRNAEWAEKAVREGVSLAAEEAARQKVVDLVATDLEDLLRQLDGRRIVAAGAERVLQTRGARVDARDPDWRTRLLAVITDPSVALILMMLGVYGLFFELASPGSGVPGVIGAICLVLGLYALQLLPVNYAGLALILLGVAFMAAEAFLPSFGVLGVGGAVAFTVGALILIDTDLPGFGIPLGLIVAVALTSALMLGAVGAFALKARRRPGVLGDEAMRGAVGEVIDTGPPALARIAGESWRVEAATALQPGQRVKVVGRRGLVLDVSPVD